MQKSKIAFIATLTASMVGIINIVGAVIAYSLVVPDSSGGNQLIASNSGSAVVAELPTPAQTTTESTSPAPSAVTSSGSTVTFRDNSQKLVPGQAPSPVGVATDTSGTKKFIWCTGINPDLPDDVCQAIISIASNPVESNPHLGTKARKSLSLLPKDTTLSMDEQSWQSTGANSGTMVVVANTAAYGTMRIKIFLEKQNNIWVLVDGQLA